MPLPDVNTAYSGVPTNGNLSTNDEGLPTGSTYNAPAANAGNPSTDVPTINPDGTYTFTSSTPGVYTFNVLVVTPQGDTVLVPLQITVVPSNQNNNLDPIANTDVASTTFNNPTTINTLANDAPAPGGAAIDPTSVTVPTQPTNGTVTVNPTTGAITYTPTAGFIGTDTITYTVTDVDGNTATAIQVVTVLAPNAGNNTTAADDFATANSGVAATGNALANDTDPQGNTQATVPQTITTAQGTFSIDATGNYTFTPVAGFSGPVSFPYTVYDNNTNPDSAKGTINILIGQPQPLPLPDVNTAYSGAVTNGNLSTNDEGLPTGSTYNAPNANPSNPSTDVPTINPDGTYTFTTTTPGVYTFNIPVVTPQGDTILVPLQITVVPDNQNNNLDPIANTDIASTTFNNPTTINTLANDAPAPSGSAIDPTSVTVPIQPSNGTVTVNPTTGAITYTPTPGFIGTDTITYTVTDVDGNTATAIQVVTVLAPNAGNNTTAADDFATANSGVAATGNALANDTDPQGNTQATVPQTITTAQGTFSIDATGNYTFTPVAGFSGAVSFPYTVYDNNTNPDSAKGTINILIGQPQPLALPDVNTAYSGAPTNGNLSTNDEGLPTGSTYNAPVPNASNPSTDVPTINADGTYAFTTTTPGVYTFNIPVVTPQGDTVLVPLQITVLPSNQNNNLDPIANTDVASTTFNNPTTINTLANDAPAPGGAAIDPTSVTVPIQPSNGTVTVNPTTGAITYTPTAGFIGTDTITYTVTDVDGNTATAIQVVTVLAPNAGNNTTAADDFATDNSGVAATGNALANDTDPQGNTQATVPQTITTAQGTFSIDATGNYTFTPVAGFSGAVSFPYTVYDNNTNPDSAKGTINILIGQPQPIVNADINAGWMNIPISGDINTNETNLPIGTNYYSPNINSTNPDAGANTPIVNSDGTYTFNTNTPGVYNFSIPIVLSNGDTIYNGLQITILDTASNINPSVANTDLATTSINSSVTINTLENDFSVNFGAGVGFNPTTVVVTTPPTKGTATVNASTGQITYVPNNGFKGMDTIFYSVTDSLGNTSSAYQIITVVDTSVTANTTTASDDYASVNSIASVSGNVLNNDMDVNGDTQSVIAQTTVIAGIGTFNLNSNGSYTFIPEPGYVGSIGIPYQVIDNNGATAFATIYFTIKATSVPLSIGFVTLKGISQLNKNLLIWNTINEKDIAKYELYRSDINGIESLQDMQTSKGNGNNEYDFTDKILKESTYNYYVKVIDIAGKVIKSNVITLSSKLQSTLVSVYPNPVVDQVNVEISVIESQPIQVKLYNNEGKIIYTVHSQTQTGNNKITIPMEQCAPGNYYVEVLMEGQEKTVIKVLKSNN